VNQDRAALFCYTMPFFSDIKERLREKALQLAEALGEWQQLIDWVLSDIERTFVTKLSHE